MESDFDRSAINVIVVFGALTIGGLMAAALVFGTRDSFLLALGASASAWLAGYAMILERPRAFGGLVALAVLMSLASLATLVT
jgi:hypothetical protein